MADYISRETAVAIFRAKADMGVLTPAQTYFNRAAAMIALLPAADVEPVVRANWQFLSGSPGTVRCSNCGAEFEENPYAQYRGKWIGCPACRAKMQMIMDLEDANDG